MSKGLFILFMLFVNYIFPQSNFDLGYKEGYERGYCYQEYGCIPPITPISPIPNLNENSNNYNDGYLRGFIDGKNKKGLNSGSNSSYNMYKPREYGNYIEPYNFDELNIILTNKQREYDNRSQSQLQNEKLVNYYQEKLNEASSQSFNYYKESLIFINKYVGYIVEFKEFRTKLEILNPEIVYSGYSKILTLNEVKQILRTLEINNNIIKNEIIYEANNLISYFAENPNAIILGKFEVNQIEDYYFNRVKGDYELTNTVNGKSNIIIERNEIYYYRNDKKGGISSAFKYSGLRNGFHIFEDGWKGIVTIDKEFKNLTIYYDKDVKTGNFMRMTIYHNLKASNPLKNDSSHEKYLLEQYCKKIDFLPGKALFNKDSYSALQSIVKLLKNNYPSNKIKVEGHLDSHGNDNLNLQLSQDRADEVKKYLISNGIESSNIISIGLGESMPIDTNKTSEGRANNRRINIIII